MSQIGDETTQTTEEAGGARPWETLSALIQEGDAEGIRGFLKRLPAEDRPVTISRLYDGDQTRLLALLPADLGGEMLQEVPDIRAPQLLEQIEPSTAAPILRSLPSDRQVDLIAGLHEPDAILQWLEPEEADQIRELAQYPPEEAGGLMIKEYLGYPETYTTHDVIEDLREQHDRYAAYESQYVYALGDRGRLTGVVPIRNLLLAPRNAFIGRTMIREPIVIPHHATLDEIETWFSRYPFIAMPVVDEEGTLLGVLTRRHVLEALSKRADRSALKRQGLVEEELRSMPWWRRSRGRLSWLSVNIFLNIIAASVIAMHQDTLAAVISLAVFLPIISDMSGCSGNQAVAVSMREMTLGLLRPREVLRVLWKEAMIGVVNGVALGAMIAVVAMLWQGNPWLGFVVGAAMFVNTLIAVCIGGTVPMLIKQAGKDPALASGPILTTITDLCGFFLILTIASLLLPKLTG